MFCNLSEGLFLLTQLNLFSFLKFEIWKKKKTLFTHDCEFSLCTNIFRKMTPVKHWVLHSWPNWFLFFSVLCFKINPAVRQTHFFFPPLSLFYRHSQDKIRGETHQSPWLLSDKLFIWRVSCLVSLVSSSSALLIWNIALHNEGEK